MRSFVDEAGFLAGLAHPSLVNVHQFWRAHGRGLHQSAGLGTFTSHMRSVFNQLVGLRDSGINRRVPMLTHDDARVMPLAAGAGLGQGPSLHPVMEVYAVPMARRLDISDELIVRMARLIARLMGERDPPHARRLSQVRGGMGRGAEWSAGVS